MNTALRLSDERMEGVAAENGNVVYTYRYDEPQKEADVIQTLKLAKIALLERGELPNLSDEDAFKTLIGRNELLALFSVDHPTIFRLMTCKDRCGESYEMLRRLAVYKLQSEHAGLSIAEATARVSQFLMGECGRQETEPSRNAHAAGHCS